jgi:hypothetical protein
MNNRYRNKPTTTTTAGLKYYIPYALVVEEKKKKEVMRACVRAHTYTIGKKNIRKSVRLLVCLVRDSFLQASAQAEMAMYVL